MTGSGPFGREPAGVFNFSPPARGQALYLEPSPKRVRVIVAGEAIADSTRAMLLHESGHQPIYYFPLEDVRSEFLSPSDRQTRCPKKGEASYYTIAVGDRVIDAGAWYYPTVLPGAPADLAGLVAFYFNRMDQWLEEDEEIFGHPRDPYHRIDVRASSRRIRVSVDGEVLAETLRAVALFESNLPVRWYMPAADVVASLDASDTETVCPYKGTASYYSIGDLSDLVWFYPEPLMEAGQIAGLVCFYNERVDIEIDGELQARPETPWSHARAAAPAQTRG
jgi:uncharacterized protein (DUF427 family)